MRNTNGSPYRLETVARACRLLQVFAGEHETVRFSELVRRAGLNKTIAFRLVHTLTECGLLERTADGAYRSRCRLLDRKRFRIGYAAQAEGTAFSATVTESVRRAAAREGLEVLILDNSYSPKTALSNARRLVAEKVDVALEFQTFERVAPAIAALFRDAGIPLIAVEIPHPGAVFYGADNYHIGLSAGRLLGKWASQHWDGGAEEVLLLELGVAGAVPQLRLSGAETGLMEVLPHLRPEQVVHVEARGEFGRAFEQVRRRLQRTAPRRTLITGINDPVVLGALRAFEEAGRAEYAAGVGLGAIHEARAELRKPGSRLIASVAFFPEHYGEDLVQIVLDVLQKKPVPPAVYARYQLVTPANVDRLYPPRVSGER